MFYAITLAKKGYFNGNPSVVLQAPVDIVFSVLKYENAEKDYLECYNYLQEQENGNINR